jgi:uncharacterized phage protein gp47/JayE
MTFRKKTTQEIVDELLSDLTSGVVDEAHRFESGKLTYDLNSTPVRNISSIRGTAGGLPYTFSSSDYELELVNKKSVRWTQNGTKPDDDTVFYLNYNSEKSSSPITDRNIGSVTRTIVEAISGEIATLYAQLEKAYLSAFIDTAEGKSLEFVVSILNVERIKAGRAEGKVTFSRATGALGDITIPVDTVLSTGARKDGERKFKTIEKGTLHEGDTTVEVPVHAEEPGAGYVVEIGDIHVIPKPIVGIEQVTNYAATVISTEDESDERLRQRAKAALYGIGKATVDAIKYAALEEGARSVRIREMPFKIPGEVEIIADCAEEDKNAIEDVVNETRAAGIKVYTRLPDEVQVELTLELTVPPNLLQEEKDELQGGVKDKITDYITYLDPGERVLASKIIGLATGDQRVLNARISDVKVNIVSTDNTEKTEKTAARIMAGNDIMVQPKEKAVLKNVTIDMITESPAAPPEEVGEALHPIKVEIDVVIALKEGTTKEQAENIIGAKARVYLSELGVDDSIDRLKLKGAIENDDRYTVTQVILRNFHSLDGLVVILTRDDEDKIREGESIFVETVNVKFS